MTMRAKIWGQACRARRMQEPDFAFKAPRSPFSLQNSSPARSTAPLACEPAPSSDPALSRSLPSLSPGSVSSMAPKPSAQARTSAQALHASPCPLFRASFDLARPARSRSRSTRSRMSPRPLEDGEQPRLAHGVDSPDMGPWRRKTFPLPRARAAPPCSQPQQ